MITKYNVGSREPVIFGVGGIMTREGETKTLYCHMIAIAFARNLFMVLGTRKEGLVYTWIAPAPTPVDGGAGDPAKAGWKG